MEQAFRKEVLPEAVPPEKRRLISFWMQSQTSAAIWLDMVPFFIMAVMVHGFLANFLIVIVLPTCDIGKSVALTLDPSASSASMSGARLFISLPILLPICAAWSYIDSSLSGFMLVLHQPSSLWKIQMQSWEPLTAISSRLSSAMRTSRSPSPSIMLTM